MCSTPIVLLLNDSRGCYQRLLFIRTLDFQTARKRSAQYSSSEAPPQTNKHVG